MNDTLKCQIEIGGNLRTGSVILCGDEATAEHPEYCVPVCWEHDPSRED